MHDTHMYVLQNFDVIILNNIYPGTQSFLVRDISRENVNYCSVNCKGLAAVCSVVTKMLLAAWKRVIHKFN